MHNLRLHGHLKNSPSTIFSSKMVILEVPRGCADCYLFYLGSHIVSWQHLEYTELDISRETSSLHGGLNRLSRGKSALCILAFLASFSCKMRSFWGIILFALVALKLLVLLIGHFVACTVKIVVYAHRPTDKQSTVTVWPKRDITVT